jgi:hypothetical protein
VSAAGELVSCTLRQLAGIAVADAKTYASAGIVLCVALFANMSDLLAVSTGAGAAAASAAVQDVGPHSSHFTCALSVRSPHLELLRRPGASGSRRGRSCCDPRSRQ